MKASGAGVGPGVEATVVGVGDVDVVVATASLRSHYFEREADIQLEG